MEIMKNKLLLINIKKQTEFYKNDINSLELFFCKLIDNISGI